MPISRLGGGDREFFARLGEVVFGNLFSATARREDRPPRPRCGARRPGQQPGGARTRRGAVARTVAARRREALQRFGVEDRRLLELAFLYVCYHRYVPQIDALIERQATRGGPSLAVPFAGEAIAQLSPGHESEERVVRVFGFFFQLRRAFYFIHRSLAGECESMRKLREALWNSVFTHDMRGYEAGLWNRMEDFSTLLLGETGTGKGSAAAAI